ncbi:MAG: phospho-N-acetylmuramoyl-pentapeptide-transferase [Geminocystis sp.]|nr:phospho-N-acetylmuramoyl-pentapeptide-transferase [Geminocystis sp.]HIK37393.1 phospho-N-acetylmuramoyl-pentapeptide-transferase [Geminocystis sp. M7585_C2015_104]MCS7147434.1 phospho-N-acetylmuramoyl-pentapeptide-transferase [Geminocystis sp.]MCX8079329.1 phospho-N-acetylmuramoyl-pentapeptide-transferase [Geminocystis sp.]MDW8117167.1 phospho-N-acetylmuramoyl-pentapeptide-transferase [Geminocystis sp.]
MTISRIYFNPSGRLLLFLLTVILGVISLFTLTMAQTLVFWITATASALLGAIIVPILREIKASQIIQEDGPQSHLKKAGTPTMGGVFFIPPALLIGVIAGGFTPTVIAVALVILAYAFIGWLDDWQILRKKTNLGLTPSQKLLLQTSFAILFCLWLFLFPPRDNITTISLPFNIVLPLNFLFWFLAVFVIVAESNATNLTDGVDGLAGGTCAIAFLGLGIIIGKDYPDLLALCLAVSGGCLGFLVHNRHRANVFMGDTGSLALGAGLAAVGILTGQLWSLFVISLLFFIESLSVIAQVTYYKATKGPDGKGKRLLKMAPLHHHLELSGWTETQIVGLFYMVNTLLILVSIPH